MQLGDYRVEIIQDTEFHLDGGAMFGVSRASSGLESVHPTMKTAFA
jgi:hypothetical protein